MRHLIILASLLLIISNTSAKVSLSQGVARKHSDSKNIKRQNIPAEVTVLWAKRALQGFNLRVWLSNQMVLGLQAWDCDWGDCIPAYPSLGAEFPRFTYIEHLYAAAPWIGAIVNGKAVVTEGYDGYIAKKELLPLRSDTLRDRIWVTSVDSMLHPNKKGIDDDGDGLIDEDELDGNDNDGDWNPLTDDLGTDGIPDSYEIGCKESYDSITNPDPAYDNYDPFAYDSCRINPDSTPPLKNDRNRYTENNGIPDHGEPNVDEDYAAWSDRDLYCSATDTFDSPVVLGHIPMGVQVYQKSFAWATSVDSEAFIIIEYDIRNIGRNDWCESSVGFFADMDVGPEYVSKFWEHNYVAYDQSTKTAYTHNIIDLSTPLGITFLGASTPLDSIRFVFRWYDFTTHIGPGQIDSMIYKWMKCDSGTVCIDSNQSPTSPSDTKVYIGLSGLTLHPGEVIKLYYAIVSSYTIEGMLDNARLAQSVYDSVYILDIENQLSVLPKSFALNQNYPNPFNPSTQISYSIPKATDVKIQIFDILGEKIAVLVNERKQPGEYKVTWNAEGVPSGVYFYRIVAGDFVETKKMVVMK